eukprot:43808-Amphidinium_carterae.1
MMFSWISKQRLAAKGFMDSAQQVLHLPRTKPGLSFSRLDVSHEGKIGCLTRRQMASCPSSRLNRRPHLPTLPYHSLS